MTGKKIISIIVVSVFACSMSLSLMSCSQDKPGDSATEDSKQVDLGSDETGINGLTSIQLTSKIRAGWNLGDTLDSIPDSPPATPEDQETAWGAPVTTKAMIDEIKAAGFNAVRVPVTWFTFTGDAPDYTLDPAWLDRVQEVADYVITNDMFCIVDAHYEDEEGGWLSFLNIDKNGKETALTQDQIDVLHDRTAALWSQIAEKFAGYDEHLIFDCFNEPRTVDSENEWAGGTPEEKEILNSLYQTFVDTIRDKGGKNYDRHLLCATYAADGYDAIDGYVLPHDPRLDDDKDSRIMVSVHAYEPYEFTLAPPEDDPVGYFDPANENDTASVNEMISNITEYFLSKDIAVIIGECGAANRTYDLKDDGENNLPDRVAWASFYFSALRGAGVPCCWWDPHDIELNTGEGFGLLNRFDTPYSWYWPEIVSSIMEATECE